MVNTKEIEQLGYSALEKHLKETMSRYSPQLRDCRNKGNKKRSSDVGDAILDITMDGKPISLHVEIKATLNATIPTNIRFATQTIKKLIGGNMLVAIIMDVASKSPKFAFFMFSDAEKCISAYPTFQIQRKQIDSLRGEFVTESILDAITKQSAKKVSLYELIDKKIKDVM